MTTGEVKGYLRQLLHRRDLSDDEKQAVQLALDAVAVMLKVQPYIIKANQEIEKRKNVKSDTDIAKSSDARSDPNTGWNG